MLGQRRFRPDPKPERQEEENKSKVRKLGQRNCANKKCKKRFVKSKPLQSVCSVECAIEKVNHDKAIIIEKRKKKQQKKDRERKKIGLQKLKTYSQKVKEARKVFQEWVRMRDHNLPCISCGAKTSKKQWDGGHYLKAEVFSGLIFNPMNVNKQCVQCNRHYHGNDSMYRVGMIKKYGLESVTALEESSNSNRVYKYSDEELDAIKRDYRGKIKDLKAKLGKH